MLVGKVTTSEEAHSYPLTTVPLALATPERDLRQGSKAPPRNYVIEEASSITEELPTRGNRLIDGMAAVKSIHSQKTWGEYAEILLATNSVKATADRNHICFIQYSHNKTANPTSPKSFEQKNPHNKY